MTTESDVLNLPLQPAFPEIDIFSEYDYYRINKSAKVLRAVNHKFRQLVIKTIHENKRLTVTQLFVNLRVEQSVVSQHLAVLRKVGIVSTEREGKFIFYTINPSRVKEIKDYSEKLVG